MTEIQDAPETTTRKPLKVADIDPNAIYSLRDLCDVFPARSGGKLSIHTARRWAIEGKITAQNNKLPGEKHSRWQITGANILKALKASEPIRVQSPAEKRRRDRIAAQNNANMLRRPFTRDGVTYYPFPKVAKS